MAGITDINWLFNKYYHDNPELLRIVMTHSEQVAKKALEIARKKRLPLDPKDIYIAAMLHDIGVVKCHAPDMNAVGKLNYLQHGVEGRKILEENKLFKFAKVCSNHTGSGISRKEIIKNNLPLPHKDFLPKTLLEKLICYADKFYSKSHDLTREKNVEEILLQMKKFGPESYQRFVKLHQLFQS